MKGHTIVAHEVERPAGGNVVDLMEVLKRSVGEGPGSEKGKILTPALVVGTFQKPRGL